MKLLSFILLLSLAQPAYASIFGEAGHGDTQDLCAYNQSSARVYKPQSVIDAEAKLKAATDKQERLEKQLDRLDCSYCESNFRKVINIVDKDNYNEYIRHLEGGSACSLAFNNVDVYNHWATFNKWEKIELFTRPKQAIRNIAGGCQGDECGGPPPVDDDEIGGGDNDGPGTPPPISRPEVEPPTAPPGCPYYAGPNYSVKSEACEVAKPHISSAEYRKCVKCVNPRDRRSYGKCLRQSARIEEQLAELDADIEELELDLEDAIEDAEDSGEEKVCADCMKDNRSAFSKWLLPGLGAAAGVGVGLLVNRASQKSYDQQVAYNQVIQDDNNAKGYPSSPFDVSNTSTRDGLIAGFAVGAPLFIAGGQASGAFGCSNSSLFGSGSVSGGSATGTQIGGATGISGILASLLGGGSGNLSGGLSGILGGGNTNGVTTGQGVIPPGYAYDATGQLVYVGNSAGIAGQPTLTTAQIEAQIAANQAQLAQLNAARTYQASYNTLTTDYYAQLNALGPNPAASGSIYGQGTSTGVIAPSSNSVVSGGVSLNLGANVGSGVYLPQSGLPGTFPQPPSTTVPIGAPGVPTPNVAPPTSTQPTGINRLIGN